MKKKVNVKASGDLVELFAQGRVIVPEQALEKVGLIERIDKNICNVEERLLSVLRVLVCVNTWTWRKPKFVPSGLYDIEGRELGGDLEAIKNRLEEAKKLWNMALEIASPISLKYVDVGVYADRLYVSLVGFTIVLGDVMVSIRDKGRYLLVRLNDSTATKRLEGKIAQLLFAYGFSRGEYGGYITRGKVNMEQVAKAVADLLNQHKDVIEKAMNEDIQETAGEIARARAALGIARPPSEELTQEDVLVALGLSQPQSSLR